MTAATSLLGRALIAAIFILAGINKLQGYDVTSGYMSSVMVPRLNSALGTEGWGEFVRVTAIPYILLPATIALEIIGGLAVLAGFHSRLASIPLAIFTLVAGLIFHGNFADNVQFVMFLKNLAIIGGFLLLFAHGPGAWAINDK